MVCIRVGVMKPYSLLLLLVISGCVSPAPVDNNATITLQCDKDTYTMEEIGRMLDYIEEKKLTRFLCNQIVMLHFRANK